MRIWSFVQKKEQTRWVWTAMCRRTQQIVALVIGDRRKTTGLRLWQTIPESYQHCHTFRDFWSAYRSVFPAETHCCVGKETGETHEIRNEMEATRQERARENRRWSKEKDTEGLRPAELLRGKRERGQLFC
jgi:insertion element IS1 protein InsB